jgi:hypothetical protein
MNIQVAMKQELFRYSKGKRKESTLERLDESKWKKETWLHHTISNWILDVSVAQYKMLRTQGYLR